MSFVITKCEMDYLLHEATPPEPTTAPFAVKATCLPGCDFMGLYANRAFTAGEEVCRYTGTMLRTVEAMRLQDKSYLMRLGEQCYVDSRQHPEVWARYINDCITPAGWNVRFDKRPTEACAVVVALRDIQPGEELFADYGRWYWVKAKPSRLLVV